MQAVGKAALSVLIPTRDEERNIAACMQSVVWAGEIVVFDSLSTDRTRDIAQGYGAKVVQREFDNFSAHKNWALGNIRFENDWILIVDADERITETLAGEIQDLLKQGPKRNGYYVARQNWFCGKWIRHGGWYPDWQLRLIRRGCARYESRIVHEHVLLDGPAGYLKNPLVHQDYKGIERYFERHNSYSSLEAIEAYQQMVGNGQGEYLPADSTGPGPGRRRLLKTLAYRYLPARSLFKFLWMYVFKLGFLDGRIGFRYCLLHTFYEYQISLKLEELKEPESPMREKSRRYLK